MTKKMLAAYVKAPFQFQLREIPIPEVRDGWVLIRVEACGICGTDLHTARSEAQDWQPFGHEVAGVVAQVGPHVATVKEGDRVVVESGSVCGHCDNCRNGRVDLCNKGPNIWSNESMGFAEYLLTPKEALAPFPVWPSRSAWPSIWSELPISTWAMRCWCWAWGLSG